MALIRLLATPPAGAPFTGQPGDVVEVDARTAQEWADGRTAERVITRDRPIERTWKKGW